MKKNTILKKIEIHEEKIIKSINDFQDFLDSIDDSEISIMAEDFCEGALDFIQENDICSIVNIREFIENEYEPEA
jgi:hypothetical protein